MDMRALMLSAAALGLVTAATASAEVEIKTFESKVVTVPPPDTNTTTYSYKVYGPNHTEYVVEGPPNEIARLAETVKTNPDTTLRFQGDFIEGPKKVFRMKEWQTNTTEHTDVFGNKTTTTTTETTRETR